MYILFMEKKLALEYYWDKMQSRHQGLHPITHPGSTALYCVFTLFPLCPHSFLFHTP